MLLLFWWGGYTPKNYPSFTGATAQGARLGLLKPTPSSVMVEGNVFPVSNTDVVKIVSSPSIHRSLGLPRLLVPADFPNISLFVGYLSFILSTCPAHFILEILVFFLKKCQCHYISCTAYGYVFSSKHHFLEWGHTFSSVSFFQMCLRLFNFFWC